MKKNECNLVFWVKNLFLILFFFTHFLKPTFAASPGISGDANADGTVNEIDYGIWVSHYGQITANCESDGNFNCTVDNKVNGIDYAIWLKNYLVSAPSPYPSISPTPSTITGSRLYGENSPFNLPIPSNAIYTIESRIGSFRQGYQEWSMPIYRLGINEIPTPVTVTNEYSGRQVIWPIPSYAQPATEQDHHLGVISQDKSLSYEMWNARWQGVTNILAGGMNSFPLVGANATGISDPPYYRVTASGFAVSAGMIVREDFTDPATGQLSTNVKINHALKMAIPYQILARGLYVPPAVGGEDASDAVGDIPLGARFALPKNLNIDALNAHQFTKIILIAARDYGIFVNDRNAAASYNGKYVGTLGVEPGLLEQLFGSTNDELLPTVQSEIYSVISQHGLYRVTTP